MSYENFVYEQPTRIVFGRNSIEKLGELALEFGAEKVLINIGGNSVRKSGLLDNVITKLKNVGVEHVLHSGCMPNPRSTWVDEGAALYVSENCNFILAVGGGSVIDASKAIAMLVSNHDNNGIWHYMSGRGRFENDAANLAAILTVSATGSECNSTFVISNEETKEKLANSHKSASPAFSICDPAYTYTVNRWQTACGVSDVVSHVLEQYLYNDDTSDVSDGMSVGILKAVVKWGPIALGQPNNFDARANLMWASTIGLNGILGAGHKNNWVVHMLEHALSAMFDISHGAGLACLTPYYLSFINKEDTAGKIKRLGIELFNIDSMEKNIKDLTIKRFIGFFKSIGMPVTLSELLKAPVTDNLINELAEKALPWKQMDVGGYKTFTICDAAKVFKDSANSELKITIDMVKSQVYN